MWYKTKEEAEKACIEKKKYEKEFVAVKDELKDIYWAVRKEMGWSI